MEGIRMEGLDIFSDSSTADFCESILHHFSNSDQEDSQRLCAIVGAMAQELKEKDLPLHRSPTSVPRVLPRPASLRAGLASSRRPVSHHYPLSPSPPLIPVAILRKKGDFVLKIIHARNASAVTCERSYIKLIREVLLLAGGSNVNPSEGVKGGQELSMF
ncbi:hypothetical protein F3Y22_tig00111957pilonHSYRG00061 [Hibiscus syriacus]|uniref:RRP12 N-terminal HEAT domain-containing protein n=1 Tax=Hibiscus syriacus TaxID=106335 RepID=A0A6A2Y5N0_HIBSY|nr:hypothetical protein F3Y22_tig00111957pilonHSYRG00061 [Hibiscus syriacus]